jgi:PAS domain S-box-containing protein
VTHIRDKGGGRDALRHNQDHRILRPVSTEPAAEPVQSLEPLPEPGDTAAERRHDLEAATRDSLPPVALGLGCLMLLLSVAHLLLLESPLRCIMAAVAGASALLLLTLTLILRCRILPGWLVHPTGAGIVLLVVANNLVHLALSGEIHQTVYVLLGLVGAAAFLPARGWFIAVLGLCVAGWAGTMLLVPPSPLLPQFAIAMAASAGLALAVHQARRSACRRLDRARREVVEQDVQANRLFLFSRELQCIVDPDGALSRWNHAFAAVAGDPPGKSLLEVIDPRDRHAAVTQLAAARNSGPVEFEARLAASGGEERWILWSAVPMADQKSLHVSGRDITVRRRMEEQLRLSFVAMESAANGIMITDRAGLITWVNPAFTRLTGWSIGDIVGKNCRVLESGAHPPQLYQALWSTITAGLVWRGELVNRRRNGTLYTEEQTIAPVHDASGEISHFVAVKTDVSERRRAEEVLRRDAERMQHELVLAEEVQEGLEPTAPPVVPGFQLAAAARPARFVSGDLYDWIPLGDDRCLLVMADISGKGVSAAMLSAAARTLVRNLAPLASGPGVLLERLNDALYADLSRVGMFITVVAVLLDARTGTAEYANAGHTEILVARRGGAAVDREPVTAPPLGVVAGGRVAERSLLLAPADLLLLYSDGVTEAADPAGLLFGIERLTGVLAGAARSGAGLVLDALGGAIDAWRRETPLEDDVTLLAVRADDRLVPLRLSATLDALEAAVAVVRAAAGRYGDRFAYETELLASELLTNIIRHACREDGSEITGELSLGADGIGIELVDRGRPFDPATVPAPGDALRESGYGLSIIQQLATTMEHVADPVRGNRWHVFRSRDAAAAVGRGGDRG